MTYKGYELTVGLEVHVELKTETKIFCSCKTEFGADPNTQCCPVCMGMPGTLPVLNKKAVEYAVKAGLALNCNIAHISKFDRKNYFYPDLPKAYQISQFDMPLCENGFIDISYETDKKGVFASKKIRITRIHLEEDAGKLIHTDEGTLIDCNRCGVPLIEIVSEPDIKSSEEAKAYLKALRSVILYTGISDCKMNEGSMRCDVNLSVSRVGDNKLGARTEIKNINSVNFVAKAIDYEFKRQVDTIESGEKIVTETRRFDPDIGKTFAMRSKETAGDYRYFPEPDLPPILLSDDYINSVKAEIPELPAKRIKRYCDDFGLTDYDAGLLTESRIIADEFEETAKLTKYPKIAANLIIGELMKLTEEGESLPVSSEKIASVAQMCGDEQINSSTAKKLLKMIIDGDSRYPEEIVKCDNLQQINDTEQIRILIKQAVENNPKAVNDYLRGKANAKKILVGYVMGKTSGLANPKIVDTEIENFIKTLID